MIDLDALEAKARAADPWDANTMRDFYTAFDQQTALALIARIRELEAERRAVIALLYTDEVFVGSDWADFPNADKGVWPVLCAHTSSYGADAESISSEWLIPLADLVARHGPDAVEAWVCFRRGVDNPVKGRLRDQGRAALNDLREAARISKEAADGK